jgi:hypothetical protein
MRKLCVQQMTMKGEIHEQGPSISQIQTNLFHKLRIVHFFLHRLNSSSYIVSCTRIYFGRHTDTPPIPPTQNT